TLADHEQRQQQPVDLDAIKLSIQQFDQQLAAVVCPELTDGEKNKLADLDEKIEEKQGELNEIQEGVKNLMEAIQKLKDTILRSEGDKTRAQKQKMELLKKTLEEKRAEKRRLTVRIRKARENAEKALKEAEHLRKDIDSLKNEEEKHRAETEKLEPVVLEILAEYNQLLNEKKEHEDELEKLKDNVKKIRDEHQEVRKREEDLKINYEEKSNKVRQHEEASRHHSKELATLKKEWNDLPTALLFEELEHDSAAHNPPPQPTQRGTPVTSPARHGSSPSLPRETPEQTPEKVKEPDEEDAIMSEHEADNDDLRTLGRAVLVDLSGEELAAVEKALSSIKSMVFALEDEIQKMQPNTRAIEDYKKKAADYKKKKDELDAVTKARDDVRNNLKQLENDRLTMFLTGFHTIREKLKELYQMITLGGDADLELVDGQDPFSMGISFSVRPPRKSWKQIANLSGGERTLASLALVFALHYYKPTPLYFMDEIDAALDQRNVAIIANYIKERTQNAQFIIITLRNSMFELADLLVGICKTNDRSKSIMVDPAKYMRRDSLDNSRISSTPILPETQTMLPEDIAGMSSSTAKVEMVPTEWGTSSSLLSRTSRSTRAMVLRPFPEPTSLWRAMASYLG
ncbi:Structural maintenance of chromosomes protein 4, partial [Perkinsus chesapeaki]